MFDLLQRLLHRLRLRFGLRARTWPMARRIAHRSPYARTAPYRTARHADGYIYIEPRPRA